MNTQEAIKAIEKMGEYEHFVDEPISKKSVLNIITQIDEPQKPAIPKFVADWIENCKIKGYPMSHALSISYGKTAEWLAIDGNDIVFAMAYGYGYTVEKPKLYTVEIPDPNGLYEYRYLHKHSNGLTFGANDGDNWKSRSECQLTESEIRKDFEWAWQAGFAKEVTQ